MEEDDTRLTMLIRGCRNYGRRVKGASTTTYQYDPLAVRHSGNTKTISHSLTATVSSTDGRTNRKIFFSIQKDRGTYQWRVIEPTTEAGKLDVEWLERGRAKKN
jgi:hypothetical protein